MLKTYLFLIGAIFFEVAGTMLLPATHNFTKLIPTSFLALFTLITVAFIPKENTIYWIMPLNFANVNRVLAEDKPRPND